MTILDPRYQKRILDSTACLNAAWQDYHNARLRIDQAVNEIATLIYELTTPTPAEVVALRDLERIAARPAGPVMDAEKRELCNYCYQDVPVVEINKVYSITGIRCCLKCSKKPDIVDQWKRKKV